MRFSVRQGYEQERDRHRAWLLDNVIVPFDLQPALVLDVGCSDGFWTALWHEHGFRVVGIDQDREAVEAGRELYPHLDLRIGDYWGQLQQADIVFARTLPPFYGHPDLKRFSAFLRHLSLHGDTVIACVYSNESGEIAYSSEGSAHRHHPASAYVAAAAEGCPAANVAVHTADGYVMLRLTW